MDVVVGIYDTSSSSWVWYDIIDATQDSWQTITVTVPSDVVAKIAGGTYLFVVGIGASDFTLWWSTSVYFYIVYIDHVYFTVAG